MRFLTIPSVAFYLTQEFGQSAFFSISNGTTLEKGLWAPEPAVIPSGNCSHHAAWFKPVPTTRSPIFGVTKRLRARVNRPDPVNIWSKHIA
jgi:hypothetical protein